MKKILSLISIALLIVLSACGAPNPQKAGGTAKAGKDGEKSITIAGNGGVIEKTIRDVIAPKFKKETGITVNFIPGLSGEILSKVELQKMLHKLILRSLYRQMYSAQMIRGLSIK